MSHQSSLRHDLFAKLVKIMLVQSKSLRNIDLENQGIYSSHINFPNCRQIKDTLGFAYNG